MQKYLRVRKSGPETDRAERPSLRIAAEKQKRRKAEKGERPIARPGDFSRLCNESQQPHRKDDDARPVVVVLGPSLFGGSGGACSGLAGNVGFGGERAHFKSLFLRGVNVFGQLLNGGTGESWRAGRHAGEDFPGGDAVVSKVRSGRKRREGSGGEDHGDADADFRFAEALQAGENGAGRPAADELKIERAEKQEKAEEQHFGGDHRAVGSSVDRLDRANVGKTQQQTRGGEHGDAGQRELRKPGAELARGVWSRHPPDGNEQVRQAAKPGSR